MSLVDKLVEIDGSKEEVVSSLQKKYSKLVKTNSYWGVNHLFNEIGVIPELSDTELTSLYISSAKGRLSPITLERIQEWDKKVHNSKPIVFKNLGKDFQEAVQQGYFGLIKSDDTIEKEEFDKIRKMTGVSINKETVNNAFNERIRETHHVYDFTFDNIEKATGIRPVVDEKMVQKEYRSCLRKEKLSGKELFLWEYLARTGVMPEEKTAQSAFRYLVNKKNVFDLIRFAEFTGIVPEEKIVKEAYKILANNHDFTFTRKYKELKEISKGIVPDENTIQLAYKNALEQSIFDHYFKSIKELTGINPKNEFLQKAYAKCISKGRFKNYEKLQSFFQIEPSEKVRKELTDYLSS